MRGSGFSWIRAEPFRRTSTSAAARSCLNWKTCCTLLNESEARSCCPAGSNSAGLLFLTLNGVLYDLDIAGRMRGTPIMTFPSEFLGRVVQAADIALLVFTPLLLLERHINSFFFQRRSNR